MTYDHWKTTDPIWDTEPPPKPFTVLGRHGSKYKVYIFGLTKIVDHAQVIEWAKERRAAGAAVSARCFVPGWPT
jgi:hypothetical protein